MTQPMRSGQQMMYGAAILIGGLLVGGYLAMNVGSNEWADAERLTDDPQMTALAASTDASDVSSFRDISVKAGDVHGEWIMGGARYVPASMLEGRETGAPILHPGGQPPNTRPVSVARLADLPDRDRLRVVMDAQNAADLLGIDYAGCADSAAFVWAARWEGGEYPNGEWVDSTVVNATQVVTTDPSTVTLEISQFAGETVIFGGGVTTGNSPCGMWKAEHLAINELYVEGMNEGQ